jgi:hypothetical protein
VSYERAFLDFGVAIIAIGLVYLAIGRAKGSAKPEIA